MQHDATPPVGMRPSQDGLVCVGTHPDLTHLQNEVTLDTLSLVSMTSPATHHAQPVPLLALLTFLSFLGGSLVEYAPHNVPLGLHRRSATWY